MRVAPPPVRAVPSISALPTAPPAPIIVVEQLVKRYKRATTNAVDGVSFSVAPGALFALLGPNGAGKTSTISILTTTLAPTSGSVRIAGHDIVHEANAVRQQIGIVFQNPSLDVNLTAEENVRFHATLYGLYPFRPTWRAMPAAYREQVQSLARLVGIEDVLFKPVKTFSGGMKRKLEIVRSLLHRPAVLFLDEPTSGLDPDSRRSLWEYLREVRQTNGTTVFLTTHYLEEAEQADTICIINHGRIVAYGTPDQLKAELTRDALMVDADDRAQLRSELKALAIPFTEAALVTIPLQGHTVHQLLRTIQTPLSVVQTHTPTLEDAYLAIVRPV